MESAVAFLIAQGWASGLSVWAVLVITGIADRLGYVDAPGLLGSPWVLAGSALLLAVEFVADKVPFLDSVSDTAQTLVRPLVGAGIGAEWASAGGHLPGWAGAVIAGGTALASHGAKMGIRAAVNTSPEPVSNVLVSSAEDTMLAGVVAFSFAHPTEAAVAALILLAVGVVLAVWLVMLVRRLLRSRRRPPPGRWAPRTPVQRWITGDRDAAADN